MRTLFNLVLMTSLTALSVPAFAASPVDFGAEVQQASLQPQLLNVSMPAGALAPSSIGAPVSLLAPNTMCAAGETRKVCEVRLAAARRASEVIAVEARGHVRSDASMDLLIPATALLPVASTANCDPGITVQECERQQLKRPTVPPGRIPPMQIPPPISPLPPTPPELGKVQPTEPLPPIATDSEAVLPPPPTGDHAIVVPPPPTDLNMPVIKPKRVQPAIP